VSAHELTAPGIPDAEAFLLAGEIEVDGRMPWSSNATFLVTVHGERDGDGPAGDDTVHHHAIYKPVRGERPLWDFEAGLHRRERAAFVLSEHLGLGVVPPTVLRDGPFGEGSVQWFVDADHSEHYFTIFEQWPVLHDRLRDIALFDVLANNTDRKSGHCLLAHDQVWAIDNGLCFSVPDKLRTVIWEFAGESVPADRLTRVEALCEAVPSELTDLLDEAEVEALRRRAAHVLADPAFPDDPTGHRYPWPLV
jgi:uncharacterized repeat protein (TIGR03843 family)